MQAIGGGPCPTVDFFPLLMLMYEPVSKIESIKNIKLLIGTTLLPT